MKFERFEIYVNGKYKTEVDAANAEMVYRGWGCFLHPQTPVTIVNKQTRESRTFTRQLDNAGNLLRIITH